MSGLSVRGLTVRRAAARGAGGGFAIEDVSFSARLGGVTAVLGPAGSGKTVLLAAVAGLLRAERGAVFRASVDVSGMAARRRGIGLLAPGSDLGAARTLQAALLRVAGRQGAEAVAAVMAAFGLAGVARTRVAALSHGEGFAALAAARLLPPGEVLLVDEAGCGLDAALRAALMRELRRLAGAGRAVVFATRDETLALQADDLVLLRGGQVLQAGAPAALYAAPRDETVARMTGPANVVAGIVRQKIPGAYIWAEAGLRFSQAMSATQPPPALGFALRLCLRPEQIALGAGANALQGVVRQTEFGGAFMMLVVETALGDLRVLAAGNGGHAPGQGVTLSWAPDAPWPLAE